MGGRSLGWGRSGGRRFGNLVQGKRMGRRCRGWVGDLEPGGERGFVGLSKVVARGEARRRYGFDRRVCGKGKG